MPLLDRDVARALMEAGYMPLAEYLKMFADEDDRRQPVRDIRKRQKKEAA